MVPKTNATLSLKRRALHCYRRTQLSRLLVFLRIERVKHISDLRSERVHTFTMESDISHKKVVSTYVTAVRQLKDAQGTVGGGTYAL